MPWFSQALRHSKVKLTWDEDEPDRAQVTRRVLSRKEIEESDFRAYIASESSESEEISMTGSSFTSTLASTARRALIRLHRADRARQPLRQRSA